MDDESKKLIAALIDAINRLSGAIQTKTFVVTPRIGAGGGGGGNGDCPVASGGGGGNF